MLPERLRRVLAVDIDQSNAQLPQHAQRRGSAIDRTSTACSNKVLVSAHSGCWHNLGECQPAPCCSSLMMHCGYPRASKRTHSWQQRPQCCADLRSAPDASRRTSLRMRSSGAALAVA